jgi:hypothetical protein
MDVAAEAAQTMIKVEAERNYDAVNFYCACFGVVRCKLVFTLKICNEESIRVSLITSENCCECVCVFSALS